MVNIEKIPSLFMWIRNNLVTFISVCICILAIYGIYEFITGYAQPLGQSIATQHSDLKRAVASYTALDVILVRDLQFYKASRVGLFRFHDSEHNPNKMSFFFVSIANMVAAAGVDVGLAEITNLPAATFAPILPKMMQHQSILLSTKTMELGPLRELEEKRGTREILFVPINDLVDNLIGFITVEWLSEEDLPIGDQQAAMMQALQSDSIRISGYFNQTPIKG